MSALHLDFVNSAAASEYFDLPNEGVGEGCGNYGALVGYITFLEGKKKDHNSKTNI